MEHRGRHRLTTTLLVAVVVLLAGTASLLWLRLKSSEMDVPAAIYATGTLVDYCHTYKRQHGEWPPPASLNARGVTFIRSGDRDGVRVDEFKFGNGHYFVFEFRRDNVTVLPSSPEPTTQPSGGAP